MVIRTARWPIVPMARWLELVQAPLQPQRCPSVVLLRLPESPAEATRQAGEGTGVRVGVAVVEADGEVEAGSAG